MILYPAIDLKRRAGGAPVKGDLDATTVYGDDPGATAAGGLIWAFLAACGRFKWRCGGRAC